MAVIALNSRTLQSFIRIHLGTSCNQKVRKTKHCDAYPTKKA